MKTLEDYIKKVEECKKDVEDTKNEYYKGDFSLFWIREDLKHWEKRLQIACEELENFKQESKEKSTQLT